ATDDRSRGRRRCRRAARTPSTGHAAAVRRRNRRSGPPPGCLPGSLACLRRCDAGAPAQLANRAAFEAAVFKELDDLGRYDEAWPAMQRCNALMHRVRPYDAQGETAVVDALIRV